MRDKIQTTAALRSFLADLLVRVRDGDIDPETVREATKVAHAINESFNVELKIAELIEKGGDYVPKLGSLRIAAEEDKTPLIGEGTT